LTEKRAAAEARHAAIAVERKRLGYGIHADGDAKAKAKLDKLNAEAAALAGEIESLAGAVEEAEGRIERARQAEAQAEARKVARRLLKMADALMSHAQSLDDANAIRVEASNAIHEELTRMRELAHGLGVFVPSHEQFISLASRADMTTTMQTPYAREAGEHLPPGERRDHMSYAAQWRDAIVKGANAILGEQPKEREVA
jgi:hypothetical protein